MTAAKLGVGTYAFRWSIGIGDRVPTNPMTPCQVIDAASEAGLTLVQFADNLPLHTLPSDEVRAVAEHAKKRGVTIELGVQGCDSGTSQQYVALCEVLDADLIRVALDAEEAKAGTTELAAQFRKLLPDCRAAGVRLAIENHFHISSAKLVEIVQAVDDPALGVCLDVANSICAHEWPSETVMLLAPYAINLHLKDYRIEPDPYGVGFRIIGVPLGEGALDIKGVFAELRKHGREVNTIVEHWLPRQENEEETRLMELAWLDQSVGRARETIALTSRQEG